MKNIPCIVCGGKTESRSYREQDRSLGTLWAVWNKKYLSYHRYCSYCGILFHVPKLMEIWKRKVLRRPAELKGSKRKNRRWKMRPSEWMNHSISPAFVKQNGSEEEESNRETLEPVESNTVKQGEKKDLFVLEVNRPRLNFSFRWSPSKEKNKFPKPHARKRSPALKNSPPDSSRRKGDSPKLFLKGNSKRFKSDFKTLVGNK